MIITELANTPKLFYTPLFSLADIIFSSEGICENVTVLGE